MTKQDSPAVADSDEIMRRTLEDLLEKDESITARSVARHHPSISAASSITRNAARRQMLEDYQQRQHKLRGWRERTSRQSGRQTAKLLATHEQEIVELRATVQTLTASHLAMIRAVGELGGFRKWAQFYETYRGVREQLVNLGALDQTEVVAIHSPPDQTR